MATVCLSRSSDSRREESERHSLQQLHLIICLNALVLCCYNVCPKACATKAVRSQESFQEWKSFRVKCSSIIVREQFCSKAQKDTYNLLEMFTFNRFEVNAAEAYFQFHCSVCLTSNKPFISDCFTETMFWGTNKNSCRKIQQHILSEYRRATLPSLTALCNCNQCGSSDSLVGSEISTSTSIF